MTEVSDFSGTGPTAEVKDLDIHALQGWLSDHVPSFAGPLTLDVFRGGQSNPTYRLVTPRRSYVMRTKPGPASKLLPSAHAIQREFRAMSRLASTEVPVPAAYALCEDESVIGRAFYVMDLVQGRVLWDPALPDQTPVQRAAIYDEINRVQAAIHRVNPEAVGLSDFGRPGSYLERQIARWTKQYLASVTQPIAAMDRLIEWLPANMPAHARDSELVSIVHGDFRLDNLMFHPTEPRVIAVLDWELSTLGHPLADFSYYCMNWRFPPGDLRGLAGLDLRSLGIPSEAECIDRYCERTGFASAGDLLADWSFYLVYNIFRAAAITQGIAKRVEIGTASSPHAKQAGARAKPLADIGWQIAQG